ncbi:GatB/YqeY domain-containing protein [Candidatus Falkowbacteria bacterium]|nr:GatB/YqeY domain-containing protein [Candidatus Falkowbacteria bacterium]
MDGLKPTIQNDLKTAMKNKDAFLLSVLRMVSAAIKNKELEKRTRLSKSESVEKLDELSQLTEEEILGVVASEAKKRKDAALEFESGGRPELAEKELKEAEFLKKYLPEQMLEDEIRKLVIEAVQKVGATSPQEMGKVMGALMPQVKGRADGGSVNRIVKEELEKRGTDL